MTSARFCSWLTPFGAGENVSVIQLVIVICDFGVGSWLTLCGAGACQFAREVKGVDLRSTAGNCAWVPTPQLTRCSNFKCHAPLYPCSLWLGPCPCCKCRARCRAHASQPRSKRLGAYFSVQLLRLTDSNRGVWISGRFGSWLMPFGDGESA